MLKGKNILLVDDDPDLVSAMRTILDESGANIQTARDGSEAITIANEFDPDLIVLDAMLPKRSGFLVLEKLKGPAKKKGQKPLVIMITGNEGKRHQVWAQTLGVDGYFTKPFRMERLIESIETLLGNGAEESLVKSEE